MAKTINASGTYKVKDTQEEIEYSFSYLAIDSIEDAVEELSEAKVLNLVQRMIKVDANNLAREKARSANGHSTRAVLSEEQKAERKSQRAEDRNLLARIKGLDAETLAKLGINL